MGRDFRPIWLGSGVLARAFNGQGFNMRPVARIVAWQRKAPPRRG